MNKLNFIILFVFLLVFVTNVNALDARLITNENITQNSTYVVWRVDAGSDQIAVFNVCSNHSGGYQGQCGNVTIAGTKIMYIQNFRNNTEGVAGDNVFPDRSYNFNNGTCVGVQTTCPTGNRTNSWDSSYGSLVQHFTTAATTGISVADRPTLKTTIDGSLCMYGWVRFDAVNAQKVIWAKYLSGGGASEDWVCNIGDGGLW